MSHRGDCGLSSTLEKLTSVRDVGHEGATVGANLNGRPIYEGPFRAGLARDLRRPKEHLRK